MPKVIVRSQKLSSNTSTKEWEFVDCYKLLHKASTYFVTALGNNGNELVLQDSYIMVHYWILLYKNFFTWHEHADSFWKGMFFNILNTFNIS